jgi:hypothetical protein
LTAYLILNISDTAVANKKEMIQHSQYTLF